MGKTGDYTKKDLERLIERGVNIPRPDLVTIGSEVDLFTYYFRGTSDTV